MTEIEALRLTRIRTQKPTNIDNRYRQWRGHSHKRQHKRKREIYSEAKSDTDTERKATDKVLCELYLIRIRIIVYLPQLP